MNGCVYSTIYGTKNIMHRSYGIVILTNARAERWVALLISGGTAVTPLPCDSVFTQTLPCGLVAPMAHCTHRVALTCWARERKKGKTLWQSLEILNLAATTFLSIPWSKHDEIKKLDNEKSRMGMKVRLVDLKAWREMSMNTTQNKIILHRTVSCGSCPQF